MASRPAARPHGEPAKTSTSCSSVAYCCGERRESGVGGASDCALTQRSKACAGVVTAACSTAAQCTCQARASSK
eukprot:11155805-Lingulodinium_polyedra.AAC.1